MSRSSASIAWATIALLLGSLLPTSPVDADEPSDVEQRLSRLETELAHEKGRRTFARACAACHGREGKGDGPAAADLDPRPRDLSTRTIRFRTTDSGAPPRPEDLERTIRSGLPGTAMPAFGRLFSSDEMDGLVAFIRSLRIDTDQPIADPVELPTISPRTTGTLSDGRAVYQLMGCWRCHALNGSGHGPSAAGLTDEDGVPIRTPDFRYQPLKGGDRPEDVARTLLTGLNGAPMPSYGDVLLFAREEMSLDSVPGLNDREQRALSRYIASAPTRAEIDSLDAAGKDGLRDQRLAALTHYVLSLSRRRGAGFWLFRQQPEREPRRSSE